MWKTKCRMEEMLSEIAPLKSLRSILNKCLLSWRVKLTESVIVYFHILIKLIIEFLAKIGSRCLIAFAVRFFFFLPSESAISNYFKSHRNASVSPIRCAMCFIPNTVICLVSSERFSRCFICVLFTVRSKALLIPVISLGFAQKLNDTMTSKNCTNKIEKTRTRFCFIYVCAHLIRQKYFEC